ncbi:amino acid ABC transporter permease [Haloechinothrix halophila]|uniref:amino acid ABC transporter permease n=1 Tax=Haloechinothrix halophila TaxID=1069073 RepID=UPI0004283B04|nr:amino acid ABC transporter permease [Haloechinothrix halophila]
MTTDTTVAEAGSAPRARLSPRKRKKISLAIQYAVFAAVVVMLAVIADWPAIQHAFFNLDEARKAFPDILAVGLKNTIIYTLSGYVLGFFLGLIVALMRLSDVLPYRAIALVYIEVFRGLPAIVVFMILGFGVPIAFQDYEMPYDPYGTVALALGLVSAAYLAETFRAGIQAVPKGQTEAARSLGMSQGRAMFTVIVPQAIRIVIPPLTNELILLFKDSSLVFVIGFTLSGYELFKFGESLSTRTGNSTPLIVAGLLYLCLTVPLGYLVRRLEAKQKRGRV